MIPPSGARQSGGAVNSSAAGKRTQKRVPGCSGRHVDVEDTAMPGDDFLHDREPEPRPFTGRARHPIEALEHFAALGFGNAGTRVLDAEERRPIVGSPS